MILSADEYEYAFQSLLLYLDALPDVSTITLRGLISEYFFSTSMSLSSSASRFASEESVTTTKAEYGFEETFSDI